jgi:hypothetical protein
MRVAHVSRGVRDKGSARAKERQYESETMGLRGVWRKR